MLTTATRRSSAGSRRFGYAVAIAVNAIMLYLVNIAPGWRTLSILTEDTVSVIPLLNGSIIAGVVVNLAYLTRDPRWLVSLGGLVTTGIGIVVLVRMWQVFPFEFGDTSVDWGMVVRVVLGFGVAGSAIGMLVQLASLMSEVDRAGPAGANDVKAATGG